MRGLSLGCLVIVLAAGAAGWATEAPLPRFTEEREAAALFFVKKHLPEMLPFLDELKKANAAQYQRKVCEIFHVTELLADIDDPKRHELEVKIWKAENRACALVARLSTPKEEERKKAESALMELARELVELDLAVLELRAEQLDKELGETRDELAKMRDAIEKHVRDRYQQLIEKVNKPTK